jgi:hypothetical protein
LVDEVDVGAGAAQTERHPQPVEVRMCAASCQPTTIRLKQSNAEVEEDEPLPAAQVGEIRHPELVRARRREVAADEIGAPLDQRDGRGSAAIEVLSDVVSTVAGPDDDRPLAAVRRAAREFAGVHDLTGAGVALRELWHPRNSAHPAGSDAICPAARTRLSEGGYGEIAGADSPFDFWDPGKVAPFVAFLCSDAAAHISGKVFGVQGDSVAVPPWISAAEITDHGRGWKVAELTARVAELFETADIAPAPENGVARRRYSMRDDSRPAG